MEFVVLTERGAELFEALRKAAGDGWMTTAELAEATEKNQLSQHDRQLLERMAERGYIEKREVKQENGFGRPALQFRIV